MNVKPLTAVINAGYVKARIRELELKIWWIAEQIKVDRKTVSRWLSGKIKWARYDNLEALAAILETSVESIIVGSESPQKATTEDFRKTAELIQSRDLKSMVRNSYNWQLFEYIVKSSITPDLPMDLLGSLYLDLAEACFFQNKIKLSAEYVEKSLAIARDLKHELLYWDSVSVKAKTETCYGNLQQAIQLFQECLKARPDAKREWRVRWNLSEAIRRFGDLEGAYKYKRKSMADFEARSDVFIDDMSWAKAWLSLGESCFDLGKCDESRAAYERATRFSEKGNFQKGIHYARLLRAVCDSQANPLSEHAECYESSHARLKEIQDDQLYYRDGALIYLSLGNFDKARQLLHDAIQLALDFPIEQGLFYQVLYKVEKRAGALADAKLAQKKALEKFTQAGARLRMEQFDR